MAEALRCDAYLCVSVTPWHDMAKVSGSLVAQSQ
jgi:hypothetical protein